MGTKRTIEPVSKKYLLLVNRYVSHLLIIFLTLIVSFINYQVQETKAEGFGESSVMYKIARGSDLADEYTEQEFFDEAPQAGDTDLIDFAQGPLLDTPLGEESLPEENPTQVSFNNEGALFGGDFATLSPSSGKREKVIQYTVAQGDTLSEIATRFEINTTTILWANNLAGANYLRPGQVLEIPPIDGIIYTIKKGDTIAKLVKLYSSTADQIIEYNKLADASDIAIGQSLIIPGGKPYYAPAPVQKTSVASIKKLLSGPTTFKGGGFIWPTTTRRLSQYFTWRHTGIDVDGEFGDAIWAADEGEIVRVQYLKRDYGYHVIVRHPSGVETLYAHFQKIYVEIGQHVTKGQVLGEMGSTGRSTGSHLHFEVLINSKRMNPLNYVSR